MSSPTAAGPSTATTSSPASCAVPPAETRQPSAVRSTASARVPPSSVTPCAAQLGEQRGDEGVHPAAQSCDGGSRLLQPGGRRRGRRRRPLRRLRCAGPAVALGGDGGGEGPVGPDPGAQARCHHVDVEHVRVRGVDAADDGCHEPFQHAPPHPGADQRRDAGGLGSGAQRGGQQLVERGPERTRQAEGAADFRVPGIGRNAEDPGAGKFARAVGQLDPGAAGVRRDDAVREAQFGGEVRHGGGPGGEGFGAAVQGQAGHHMAADAAAPRAGGLQDRGAGRRRGPASARRAGRRSRRPPPRRSALFDRRPGCGAPGCLHAPTPGRSSG